MVKDKTKQATQIIKEIDKRYNDLVPRLFNAKNVNERVGIRLHGNILERRKRNLVDKYIINK